MYNGRMEEFVSDAIVLRKYPQGDLDGRYILLSDHFGRISAKAKSSRKITSKLAPHLEPGTIAKMRFIEAHGTQIVDALKTGTVPLSLPDLHYLAYLLPEGQPEPELWMMITAGEFSWAEALALFGWDPAQAACITCGRPRPGHFYIPRQEFFCDLCVKKLPSKLRRDAVISLYASVQPERHMDGEEQP